MKFFGRSLLLSCAVIFYQVYSITGYSKSIHFPSVNLEINSKGLAESHNIHKRQIIDTDQFIECQDILYDEQCTSGQVQLTANIALQCNKTQTAKLLQDSCQRNPMGLYCGIAIAVITTKMEEIERACLGSQSCNLQCQNILLELSDLFGCCINVIFNDTSSLLHNPDLFTYSLWSACGLEPVPNDCTNTFTTTPTKVDHSCTDQSYIQQVTRLYCSRQFIEPLLERFSNESNCEVQAQAAIEQCGVNEDGVYCSELPSLVVGLVDASKSCPTTTECSENCTITLDAFNTSAGCCINNAYNGSGLELSGNFKYSFLTAEFWRLCGIDTPGFCEVKFNNLTFISSASSHSILNIFAILLLVVFTAAISNSECSS